MIKKLLLTILVFLITIQTQAFQDCVVMNNGKITDINIEDNTIIDVYPLITVMNEKNTLIVHPLKTGKTRFCALKNNKNLVLFEVEVTDFGTKIIHPEDFEVLSIDTPDDEFEFDFELDEPPGGGKWMN